MTEYFNLIFINTCKSLVKVRSKNLTSEKFLSLQLKVYRSQIKMNKESASAEHCKNTKH